MEPLTQKEGKNVTADTKVPSTYESRRTKRRDRGSACTWPLISFSWILSGSGNERAENITPDTPQGIDEGIRGTQMRGA